VVYVHGEAIAPRTNWPRTKNPW